MKLGFKKHAKSAAAVSNSIGKGASEQGARTVHGEQAGPSRQPKGCEDGGGGHREGKKRRWTEFEKQQARQLPRAIDLNSVPQESVIASTKRDCAVRVDSGEKKEKTAAPNKESNPRRERSELVCAVGRGMSQFFEWMAEAEKCSLQNPDLQELRDNFVELAQLDQIEPGYWIAEVCRQCWLDVNESDREQVALHISRFTKDTLLDPDVGEDEKHFASVVENVVLESKIDVFSAFAFAQYAGILRVLKGGDREKIQSAMPTLGNILLQDQAFLERNISSDEPLSLEKRQLINEIAKHLRGDGFAWLRATRFRRICGEVFRLLRLEVDLPARGKQTRRVETPVQLGYTELVKRELENQDVASQIGGVLSVVGSVGVGGYFGFQGIMSLVDGEEHAGYVIAKNLAAIIVGVTLINWLFWYLYVYPKVRHLDHRRNA